MFKLNENVKGSLKSRVFYKMATTRFGVDLQKMSSPNRSFQVDFQKKEKVFTLITSLTHNVGTP